LFELGGETDDDDARMMSILFTYKQCRKLAFLQDRINSEDISFLCSPEVLSGFSEPHTYSFSASVTSFFQFLAFFANPEITYYSKSLSRSSSSGLFCLGNRLLFHLSLLESWIAFAFFFFLIYLK